MYLVYEFIIVERMLHAIRIHGLYHRTMLTLGDSL